MTFTVLVPARLASTRLPNKPLADIAGVPMVVRVAQNAARSSAREVRTVTCSIGIAWQLAVENGQPSVADARPTALYSAS